MSGITVDILSTFCGVFMIRYFKFMLRIFEFGVRLFCLSQKNVTRLKLKRFTRYGHYAGEVEDNHRDSQLSLKSL